MPNRPGMKSTKHQETSPALEQWNCSVWKVTIQRPRVKTTNKWHTEILCNSFGPGQGSRAARIEFAGPEALTTYN